MNNFFNTRAQILLVLSKKECSLGELFKKINLPDTQITPHLESLTQLGILSKRKVGRNLKYVVVEESKEKVGSLLQKLRDQ